MGAPVVDICVLTYNRSDMTAEFLPYLAANTAGVDYALHLQDNGSDAPFDRNWRLMNSFWANTQWWGNLGRPQYKGLPVTIQRSTRNLNFAGGNNWLAKRGRAKWLLFLNNDVFPKSADWLYRLVETCENGDFIAAGPVSNAVMGFQNTVCNLRFPDIHPTHVLSGFCLLVLRECFEDIGGWDERFDNGDEDVDISFAIRKWGWMYRRNSAPMAINRRVYVHHECSQSLGPWCAKQGKSIENHFEMTRTKLILKRGEHATNDIFHVEQFKHSPKDWRNIGLLDSGMYFQYPASPADLVANLASPKTRAHYASTSEGGLMSSMSDDETCPFNGLPTVTRCSCGLAA